MGIFFPLRKERIANVKKGKKEEVISFKFFKQFLVSMTKTDLTDYKKSANGHSFRLCETFIIFAPSQQ